MVVQFFFKDLGATSKSLAPEGWEARKNIHTEGPQILSAVFRNVKKKLRTFRPNFIYFTSSTLKSVAENQIFLSIICRSFGLSET
jgi:hypothetical protein